MNILRIIQEAIHNSLKYANAKRINVDVSKKNSNVEFQISDDGAGFDLEKVKRGNGLNNMEKRAMEINGSLDIKSGQGKGTIIVLSV